MLKTCLSCSYIGNDGEHICPFCKSDLSIARPRKSAPVASGASSMRATPGFFSSPCYKCDPIDAATRGIRRAEWFLPKV